MLGRDCFPKGTGTDRLIGAGMRIHSACRWPASAVCRGKLRVRPGCVQETDNIRGQWAGVVAEEGRVHERT